MTFALPHVENVLLTLKDWTLIFMPVLKEPCSVPDTANVPVNEAIL